MSDITTGAIGMESDPHTWIQALRNSQNRLVALVEPLSPEQLGFPSYHAWTIADVLGHLGSQAELFLSWLQAGVEGTDPPGQEAMKPVWDSWNLRSPEQQSADSLAYNARFLARFEGLTDDQLDRLHLNLFGLELDAAGLARLRLSEHAIHTWDIAVALDPRAEVAPDAVALLIDSLGLIATRAGKPQGEAFHLYVLTTEPDREFSLRVEDTVTLAEWQGGTHDGELRVSAEEFVRLIYGRLDANHTRTAETSGRPTLDELRLVFPGV